MKKIRYLSVMSLLLVMALGCSPSPKEAEEVPADPNAVVEAGKLVQVHLKLTVDDEVIRDTIGGAPIRYVHGEPGTLFEALQGKITGMRVGESKDVMLMPEEGYGPSRPELFTEGPKNKFPEEVLNVGEKITISEASGKNVTGVIMAIREKTVILNLNHPLAGKLLRYNIRVVDIRDS